MTARRLTEIVEDLARAVSGDDDASVHALPLAGSEQTLIISAPRGTGRLLGKGGETFRAFRRVVDGAAWRTGVSFRLVISDPRQTGSYNMTGDYRDRRTSDSAGSGTR